MSGPNFVYLSIHLISIYLNSFTIPQVYFCFEIMLNSLKLPCANFQLPGKLWNDQFSRLRKLNGHKDGQTLLWCIRVTLTVSISCAFKRWTLWKTSFNICILSPWIIDFERLIKSYIFLHFCNSRPIQLIKLNDMNQQVLNIL